MKTKFSEILSKWLFLARNIFLLVAMIFITSCSQTRRLTQGEYLLDKNKINIDSKEIEKSELKKYEKQSANRRILLVKFHLFLYNLASPKKEKFPSKWFREIGEAPKIWDSLLQKKTSEQFLKYLQTKGFYDATIKDTVFKDQFLKKKRAIVKYDITLNEPYRIRSLKYHFEDEALRGIVFSDTINCLVKVGDRFDKEVFQKERSRLEELLKNNGYFRFSKEYVFFEAVQVDTSKLVDLKIIIKENIYGQIDPLTKIKKHYPYKLNNVYIHPNFALFEPKRDSCMAVKDTVFYNNNYIIYPCKRKIKPLAVTLPNLCLSGSLYQIKNVKKTYTNYTSLSIIRTVNITFRELDELEDTSTYKFLDCNIELAARKSKAFTYELVGTFSGTVSEPEYGARLNFTYNNYNIFRGAEHLQLNLTGAYETPKQVNSPAMYIGGAEAMITFPKFIVPFKADKFVRKFNPKTITNFSYNYLRRPEFVQTIANASFGYIWKGNSFNKHTLTPLDFTYVWLPGGISDSTLADFEKTSQIYRFTDHTILAARYQFEFSNQIIEKPSNFVYAYLNLELAGNLVNGLLQLTPSKNDSVLFGVKYYQYAKAALDFRFNQQISRDNRIVYRIFGGIGYPYGNSNNLPFERQFASGDANGIRAWRPYLLGPGTTRDTTYSYVKHLGDIKLEGNLEYRFDLFWVLEGALFVDAGNIWTINDYFKRPDAKFNWSDFYNDLAIGTGLGLRFDLPFLLFFTDFGLKMRDPSIRKGSKWIDANQTGTTDLPDTFWERWTFQFGLGYPF
jgi:hypothetical protein